MKKMMKLMMKLMNHHFPFIFSIPIAILYFAMLPGGAKAVAHTLTPVTIRMLQDGA